MVQRPHAVVVPYPCTGHINPALQIAALLHRHGVYVTFVSTEHNHRRALAVASAAAGDGALLPGAGGVEGFRFETIPDGLPEATRGAQDYGRGLSMSTSTRCAAPLRELLVRLMKDGAAGDSVGGVPPVTCVVPTALMSFALDVASELGLPTMVLWGCSAAALMAHMRIRELVRRGYVPLKDESYLTNGHLDTTVIDWFPGMPPISLGDISSFVRTTDADDFGLRFNEDEANSCTNAGALVLNTFDDLEPDVLAALRAEYPRIFTVGPLGTLLLNVADDGGVTGGAAGLSLWKQDTECLAWLDTQQPRSVVYLSFGSHAVVTPEQLAEFAWGLAATGHPFLLSTRENMLRGGGTASASSLPPEFMAATAGSRSRITSWCPQERVLRHRAVGCFVTHSGWNSTCESVAAGVPMVCWPGFADQYTNCKYACEAWGVGVRLDAEVRREQVAGHVKLAMESEKMRRSAARWKAQAEAAARPGGSSYENLQSMVAALVNSSHCDLNVKNIKL